MTALLLCPLAAVAQDWALEGYDPVGYVAQGRPVPGRSDIATMWKGKIWHFASEDNRARFEADPQGYAPVSPETARSHCPRGAWNAAIRVTSWLWAARSI